LGKITFKPTGENWIRIPLEKKGGGGGKGISSFGSRQGERVEKDEQKDRKKPTIAGEKHLNLF